MKKAFIALFAVALVVVAAGFGSAYYGQGNGNDQRTNFDGMQRGAFHEQMEEVMESGSFEDLESLRTELDVNLMPWVIDQATFEEAQAHHQEMEALYGEGPHFGEAGARDGSGFHRGGMHQGSGMGQGQGFHGNCPFMD